MYAKQAICLLSQEEAEKETRDYINGALNGAPVSVARKQEAAERLTKEVLTAVKIATDSGIPGNPLFDLGVRRNAEGEPVELKYYISLVRENTGVFDESVFELAERLSGLRTDADTGRALAELRYLPTLLGVNRRICGLFDENGENLFLRGIGLTQGKTDNCRVYFDRFGINRLPAGFY